MRSLDDKEIAQVVRECNLYISHNDNEDETIASIVCDRLKHLPRQYVLACAIHHLKSTRERFAKKAYRYDETSHYRCEG